MRTTETWDACMSLGELPSIGHWQLSPEPVQSRPIHSNLVVDFGTLHGLSANPGVVPGTGKGPYLCIDPIQVLVVLFQSLTRSSRQPIQP